LFVYICRVRVSVKYFWVFGLLATTFSPGLTFGALPDSVLIGTATLSDGRVYTYKLCLIDSAGVLSGYSVMDVNGAQETRAAVTGTLTRNGTELQFKETGVESSKYAGKTGFCILQGSLRLRKFGGTPVLKGHFEGYLDNTQTVCAEGKLVLIAPKDALKILKKAEACADSAGEKDPVVERPLAYKKVTAKEQQITDPKAETPDIADSKAKKDTPVSPRIIFEAPPEKVRTVLPGKTISVECPAGAVTFEIWDNKDIDGDIVTLMDGNTALIKNLTLTGTHYPIVLHLQSGETRSLRLIAVSEGSEPLNTARIRITSGEVSTFIDATSTVDKEVVIVVKGK
jgi:hypothetical protein